jgi:ureidoglycolate lyase
MALASSMKPLPIEPLTQAAFAPFGDVIAPDHARETYPINAGTTLRFHDLARVDTGAQDGRSLISLCRAQPRAFPFAVRLLERHPLGSQAFIPLHAAPYLIVVATGPQDTPRAFIAARGEGVNYLRGTWHHPLIALDRVTDFLVVDRGGSGENCDEVQLDQPWILQSPL